MFYVSLHNVETVKWIEYDRYVKFALNDREKAQKTAVQEVPGSIHSSDKDVLFAFWIDVDGFYFVEQNIICRVVIPSLLITLSIFQCNQ